MRLAHVCYWNIKGSTHWVGAQDEDMEWVYAAALFQREHVGFSLERTYVQGRWVFNGYFWLAHFSTDMKQAISTRWFANP